MDFGLTRRAALAGGAATALASCSKTGGGSSGVKTIAFVPKFTSDPYYVSANAGAQAAGKELGLAVRYIGPVDANVAGQVDIVDRLVRGGVDAISLCALDPTALAPSLRAAAAKGIKVSTWDADVAADARTVFLNQASYAAIADAIVGTMVARAGDHGDFVAVTGSLTASNMLAWMTAIRSLIAAKYPGMRIAATLLGEQDIEKGKSVVANYLRAHPETKGVLCVDGSASVSAAEAVGALGLPPGKMPVVGIGVPNAVRTYLKNGTMTGAVLWNPVDIGYAAVWIAKAQLDGKLDPASGSIAAGRLGPLKFTARDEVLLGPPLVLDRANVDRYHF